MKRICWFLLLAGIASSAALAADDQLEASIRDGNNAWIIGMQKGDAELAAKSYAADAVDCGPTGDCIVGHDAVIAKFKTRFAKSGIAKSASVHSAGHVEDGTFAYEWGSADLTGADGKVSSGRFLTVWRREKNGSWKICRNIVLPPIK